MIVKMTLYWTSSQTMMTQSFQVNQRSLLISVVSNDVISKSSQHKSKGCSSRPLKCRNESCGAYLVAAVTKCSPLMALRIAVFRIGFRSAAKRYPTFGLTTKCFTV